MVEQPALVQALLTSQVYPHRPASIDMVQTQMSFVFLTGDYVYKVKKPVNLGYLDYTTLEKRLHFCRQEVTLNRRLCPDVYLDVVPIVDHNGAILVEREGEIIEYAVKMRQLPLDRTMDNLLKAGRVSADMLGRVARKLAAFHEKAESSQVIARFGDVDTIVVNTDENFTQTEKYIGTTISQNAYDAIKSYTEGFIRENAPLFRQRMADSRIRDCHGDLHAAHVCFTDDICIFDCIEFNDRFRYSDVANEVAFLAMDLDQHGRPDLSGEFVEAYVEASGDSHLLRLLGFYKCYRAYVRGKVESFKLDDPLIPAEDKGRIQDVARRYFELARSYIAG